jgi:hypothetical protein
MGQFSMEKSAPPGSLLSGNQQSVVAMNAKLRLSTSTDAGGLAPGELTSVGHFWRWAAALGGLEK